MVKVLSLGAGVQSSTLALMASQAGGFPGYGKPDFAVFADTGWEPAAVYQWLEQLEGMMTFPVVRVSVGNIRQDLLDGVNVSGQQFSSIPFFLVSDGKMHGMGRRQCTREYKIEPITKEIRSRRTDKEPVELWIGISLDEVQRMKTNRTGWLQNVWPLIDARMTRQDCLRWLDERGLPHPPKSSCIGCPFHDDAYWRRLKTDSPKEWEDAVAVDVVIRHHPKWNAEQYMHRSGKPLAEVDLSTAEDHGQLDLFTEECEGMCGV